MHNQSRTLVNAYPEQDPVFGIFIHHNGLDRSRVVPSYENRNYIDVKVLATLKQGTVCSEDAFSSTEAEFTKFYNPWHPGGVGCERRHFRW